MIPKNTMLQVYKPKSLQKVKEVRALTLGEEKLLIKNLITSENKVYSLIFLMFASLDIKIKESLIIDKIALGNTLSQIVGLGKK